MSRLIALILLLATLTTEAAMAETTAQESRNKDLVQAGFAAWAAGTGSPYELLAEDATWTIVGRSAAARVYSSREAFLAEVIRPFNARMSQGLKPRILQLYADRDMVIVYFEASGVARDGVPYSNTYAWFLRFANERIVEGTAFFDSIAFDEFWRRVPPE